MSKLHLNGTCTDYPEHRGYQQNLNSHSQSKGRIFSINFRNRNRITDCCVMQHYIANSIGELNHCFLTATYRAGEYTASNKDITSFLNKCAKRFRNFSYVWVKEYTQKKTPHYHICVTIERVPIQTLNKMWCDSRGYFSPNALSSAKFFNPVTKKYFNQMVITDLRQVTRYISKYISKSNDSFADGRHWKAYTEFHECSNGNVWNASNNLKKKSIPVQITGAKGLIYHDYYNPEHKVIENDFCTIGFLKIERSISFWKAEFEQMKQKKENIKEKSTTTIAIKQRSTYT